jgi:hypothetical protein
MIDLERICREAGGTLTLLTTGHGQSGEAWVFHVTDYYEKPTHSLARLCNAVLEEAVKAVEAEKNPDPRYDVNRASNQGIDDAAAAIRALRVPENDCAMDQSVLTAFDTGMGTTPGMWEMLSEHLSEAGEKLPELLNEAIYALRDGRAKVIGIEES